MSDPRSDNLPTATGQVVGGRARARRLKYLTIFPLVLAWVLALVVFSLFVCVPAVRYLLDAYDYLYPTAGD